MAAGSPPLVELEPAEEQFAAPPILLRGDGTCRREPTEGVAVEPQVFGDFTGVKRFIPLVCAPDLQVRENGGRQSICEPIDKRINQGSVNTRDLDRLRARRPRRAMSIPGVALAGGFEVEQLSRLLTLLGVVRWHCRDLPKGLGRAPGCWCTAGAACLCPSEDYDLCRTEPSVYGCSLEFVARKIDPEDLTDAEGVAGILKLSHRNSVSLYQRRYSDMPRPVVDLGAGRVKLWLRPQIERWANEQTRQGRTRPARRVTRSH